MEIAVLYMTLTQRCSSHRARIKFTCKFNSSCFPVKKGRKKRGGRTARGFILHNKTNTHHIDKGLHIIGLTIHAQAGIHTMVGDYIHINGRKI